MVCQAWKSGSKRGTQAMQPCPPSPAATQDTPHPYRYGCRFMKRTQPDGSETVEQVPLTLEDVLHPQEGDVISESRNHQVERRYLSDVFLARPLGPPVTD